MSQMTNVEKYEDEIELTTLISMLWAFKGFIIRVTFLFGMIALFFSGISYMLANTTTIYEAEAMVEIYVDGSALQQKHAYVSLLSSQTNIDDATSDLTFNHDFSVKNVKVSELEDEKFIKVVVQYPDSKKVITITDLIVSQSVRQGNSVLNGVNVSTRERAALTGNTSTSKEAPNIVLNVAIALVLGGMLSVFIVFFMEYILNRVKTTDDIEKGLGLEILTTLPNTQLVKKKGWWPW